MHLKILYKDTYGYAKEKAIKEIKESVQKLKNDIIKESDKIEKENHNRMVGVE